MAPTPPNLPNPALARFPAAVLEAYQRYQAKGDAGDIDALVVAAAVDYRPANSGPAPAISGATRLLEDLAYDSVAVAELVFFFEDLFDLTLTNEDIVHVRTIGDLRACVLGKLSEKGSKARG